MKILFTVLLSYVISFQISAQNTIGLISYNSKKAFEGYNLFYPHNQPNVFLINNCGELVNTWTDEANYRPGNTAYLLENGSLVKTKRANTSINDPIWAGGGGAIIEIRSWENDLLWSFKLNDSLYRLHHDIIPMPNGNILMIAWEQKSEQEAIQAGRNLALLPQKKLWPDYILEVNPITSEVVWEWHTWDHLIQDFDATKDNYGIVADHPELIDINWDTSDGHPDWMHTNAIDYNEELDQILISVPTFSEVWVIDHSTSTEEAASHSGGRGGKGGDLLYRWGNPVTYKRGTILDQKLFYPHNIHWINDFLDNSHPHYGKIAVFNNQVKPSYSTANIFDPSFDTTEWKYPFSNNVFDPDNFDEIFIHPDTFKLFSDGLSSVQLLPNQNVLLCSGRTGYSFEMTPSGEIVWEYVTPLFGGMPASQGTILTSNNNTTFRMNRYPADFKAFEVKNLSAKGYIELNPNEEFCAQLTSIESLSVEDSFKVYPNPANGQITIELLKMQENEFQIVDIFGRKVKQFTLNHVIKTIDVSNFTPGIYFIHKTSGEIKKILIQK